MSSAPRLGYWKRFDSSVSLAYVTNECFGANSGVPIAHFNISQQMEILAVLKATTICLQNTWICNESHHFDIFEVPSLKI